MQLRQYQNSSIITLRQAFSKSKRVLFVLPTGGGKSADKPVAVAAQIPRTSEEASALPPDTVFIESVASETGWKIETFLTAAALPGWDPEESPRLGFFAATVDRRLGKIPAFGTPEFPWESDPTTWAELLLTR